MNYDLAVIGGGSAGLSIAAAAAQFGEKVVLFEKNKMGGDCLNTGCVPSKAMIAAANAAYTQRNSTIFGIAGVEPKVSYAKVMDYVQSVIATIAPLDSQERFEELGVTVVPAAAKFSANRSLEANGKTFTARRIVIATGSRAAIPLISGLNEISYFTHETIFQNRVQPKHLIIIGAGPIGLEMAQVFRRLGSQVTVLEAGKPLAKDDPELAEIVVENLKAEGVNIYSNVKVENISKVKTGITVKLADGTFIQGSHILVAAGRVPNLEGLNLEAAGIAYNGNGLVVDAGLRTSNKNVYAAGDIAGGLQFTHVASYHAGLIIRHALFKLPIRNLSNIIPWATYTDPELAQVGLNEANARARFGNSIHVLRWHFKDNDRAQTHHKTIGLVKIIVGKSGRILGAGIVGSGAGELIAPWVLAVSQKLKISAMANLVLPYPTMSEAGKRASILYYSRYTQKPWLRRVIGFLKLLG